MTGVYFQNTVTRNAKLNCAVSTQFRGAEDVHKKDARENSRASVEIRLEESFYRRRFEAFRAGFFPFFAALFALRLGAAFLARFGFRPAFFGLPAALPRMA